MLTVPFAVYDAFTDIAFGGSQAGIVLNASSIDSETRLKIARELGFPATCFIYDCVNNSVTVRFQSTEQEYSMCGHGTICLMTRMIELGLLNWQNREILDVELIVNSTIAHVEIHRQKNDRVLVMLDIQPPKFNTDVPDIQKLATLLNINNSDYDKVLPIEKACGDFNHLIVPINNLDAMQRIKPDFQNLKQYCLDNAIDTVATFCREVKKTGYDVHVRDFCPAVGVAESAAAGTTNAALTSYLIHHNLKNEDANGQIIVLAEQGLEIERPSTIRSLVSMHAGKINRLQVGGVATKVFTGKLYLPNK
ncbi:PhzF family phenazine biosynthesis protein [bacterium]|nr:PhzF family phenazine biosynthesis protein [bacterium]